MAELEYTVNTAVLKEMKLRETQDGTVTLVGNLPTQRVILNWDKATIRINPINPALDESLPLWRRLWDNVVLDYDELARMNRIPRELIESHVMECITNGWIYPDGTVNTYARQLAAIQITRLYNQFLRGGNADQRTNEKKVHSKGGPAPERSLTNRFTDSE